MRLRPPRSPKHRSSPASKALLTPNTTDETIESSSDNNMVLVGVTTISSQPPKKLRSPPRLFRRRAKPNKTVVAAFETKHSNDTRIDKSPTRSCSQMMKDIRQLEQEIIMGSQQQPPTSSDDSSSDSSSTSSSSQEKKEHDNDSSSNSSLDEDIELPLARSRSPFWKRRKPTSEREDDMTQQELHTETVVHCKNKLHHKIQHNRSQLIDPSGQPDGHSAYEVVLETGSKNSPMRKLIRSLSPTSRNKPQPEERPELALQQQGENPQQIYSDPVQDDDKVQWPSFFATASPTMIQPRGADPPSPTRLENLKCLFRSPSSQPKELEQLKQLERTRSLIQCDIRSQGSVEEEGDVQPHVAAPIQAVLPTLLPGAVAEDSDDESEDEFSDTSSFRHWVAERERQKGPLTNMMEVFDFRYLWEEVDSEDDETTLFSADTTKYSEPAVPKKSNEAKEIQAIEVKCSPKRTRSKTVSFEETAKKGPPLIARAPRQPNPPDAPEGTRKVATSPNLSKLETKLRNEEKTTAKKWQSKREVKEAMKRKAARIVAEQQRLDEEERRAQVEATRREEERIRREALKPAENDAKRNDELQRILLTREFPSDRKRSDTSQHRLIEKEILRQHRREMEKRRSPTTVKEYGDKAATMIHSRSSNATFEADSRKILEGSMHQRIHRMPHPNSVRHGRDSKSKRATTIETFPPQRPTSVPLYRSKYSLDLSVGSIESHQFQRLSNVPTVNAKKNKISERQMTYTQKFKQRQQDAHWSQATPPTPKSHPLHPRPSKNLVSSVDNNLQRLTIKKTRKK